MGDRANIFLVDSTNDYNVPGIYLYTHYHGHEWPERLRQALVAGKSRWGDDAYLARIIMSEVFSDEHGGVTGAGVSTTITDNSYLITIVDLVNSTVAWAKPGDENQRGKWCNITDFDEFVKVDPALYPDDPVPGPIHAKKDELVIPEKIEFVQYVHHDPDEYQVPEILERVGVVLPEEDWDVWEEKFGRPFYELELNCEWNTVTGKVTILAIDGKQVES